MVSFLVCVFFFLLRVETTLVRLFPTSAAHTFNSASLFLHFNSVSRSRLMLILKKKKSVKLQQRQMSFLIGSPSSFDPLIGAGMRGARLRELPFPNCRVRILT